MKTVWDSFDIQSAVRRLANHLTSDYLRYEPDVVFLIVLNGAFRFASDLLTELPEGWNPKVDFIQTSSYHGSTTPGVVDIVREPSINLRNQHVIVLEDIIDRGHTIHKILDFLALHQVASVTFASLFRRDNRAAYTTKSVLPQGLYPEKVSIIEMLGVPEDTFLVGYGLDFEYRYRGLNSVAAIEFPDDIL